METVSFRVFLAFFLSKDISAISKWVNLADFYAEKIYFTYLTNKKGELFANILEQKIVKGECYK